MDESRQDTRAEAGSPYHPLRPPEALVRDRKQFVVDLCRDRGVLHIGCVGSGSVADRLRDGSHLHARIAKSARSLSGIDINVEGLSVLREAGFEKCFRRDIEKERIEDSILFDVDVIVIPEVLEHLPNPGRFLRHLKALNFTGDILISVPNAFSFRGFELVRRNGVELVHPDHKYYFSQTTLKTLLCAHGFTVVRQWLYYWPSEDAFGRDFEKALQISPHLAEGIIVLARDSRPVRTKDRKSLQEGEAQFLRGDLVSAERTFLEILRADPKDVEAYNNLGVLEFARNNPAAAIRYFSLALETDPFYREAVLNLADMLRNMGALSQALPHLEKVRERYPDDSGLGALIEEARTLPSRRRAHPRAAACRWKICYSPGVAHHGERYRQMLGMEHYIPSLHRSEPVWFFGVYFEGDYMQLLAHQGKKIVNWRGSDALKLRSNPQRVSLIKAVDALHVCQSRRQQAMLEEFSIPSIVRPMLNRTISEIPLSAFPQEATEILIFWKSGIDEFIRADLFFEVASRCPEVRFHIVGEENPSRFNGAGMENLSYHGFIAEEQLDSLMDRCKGTIRPWVSDGTPNIQSIMLLKGRYAAHSCEFDKVARCHTADDYVRWIDGLKEIRTPNLEAREWWMEHLNNFDFLEPDFNADRICVKGAA